MYLFKKKYKPYETEDWQKKSDMEKLRGMYTEDSPIIRYYKDHPEEYRKQQYLKEHGCYNNISDVGTIRSRTGSSSLFKNLYYDLKWELKKEKNEDKKAENIFWYKWNR